MVSNSIPSSLEGLLEQFNNSDPKLQQKLQLISRLINSNQETAAEADRHEQRRAKAKQRLKRLQREYEILAARNDELAAALGACPACWGENESCQCRGRGSPGYFPPQEEGFNEYVMPVLERLGLVQDDTAKSEGD